MEFRIWKREDKRHVILLFQFFWMASLLLFPWQTRWFRDASLLGWPWEQGRLSVYASWIFLVMTVLLGQWCSRRRADPRIFRQIKLLMGGILISIGLAMLISGDSQARLVPVFQWLVQITILVAFAFTLWRVEVPWRRVGCVFVLSLLPHVLLGYWQYATQEVIASKWLGVASHLPQVRGTSVIEQGGSRVLRMYGGFPHPNIFGGWLAIGSVMSVCLAMTSARGRLAMLWSLYAGMLSGALVLTYARSAWIAWIVGLLLLSVLSLRGLVKKSLRWYLFLPALVSAFIPAAFQRDYILARVDPSLRLEARSIDTRTQSLRDGLVLFQAHPWFGTGPNAELRDPILWRRHLGDPAPLEPPHMIYLLILVNLGIVGSALLLFIAFRLRFFAFHMTRTAWPFIIPLGILGLFDHYLWSLWSGQSLAMLVVLLVALWQSHSIFQPTS